MNSSGDAAEQVVTKHKAIDMIRSHKRLKTEELIDTFPGRDLPFPVDSGLADAMAKLPDRYCEVLRLRFNDGYSTKEVERFLALLSHIRNVAIYDDTVMSIIMTESEEFFAEHKTAEETAKVIQSKISLYVAEQQ